jgi:hypothetical protein
MRPSRRDTKGRLSFVVELSGQLESTIVKWSKRNGGGCMRVHRQNIAVSHTAKKVC